MLLVFASLKGGVGKTSFAALFATYLSRSREVVTVDRDYQGALTEMLGAYIPAGTSIEDLVLLKKPVSVVLGGLYNITHYPLTLDAWDYVQRSPFAALYGAVSKLKNLDVVIIDTGSCRDSLLVSSLAAADVVVTPITPSPLAAKGVELLAKLISMHPSINPKKIIMVPSLVTKRNIGKALELATETANRVRLAYGLEVDVLSDAVLWRFSMVQTARGDKLLKVFDREPRLEQSMRNLANHLGLL